MFPLLPFTALCQPVNLTSAARRTARSLTARRETTHNPKQVQVFAKFYRTTINSSFPSLASRHTRVFWNPPPLRFAPSVEGLCYRFLPNPALALNSLFVCARVVNRLY